MSEEFADKVSKKVMAELESAIATCDLSDEDTARAENMIKLFSKIAVDQAFDAFKHETKEKVKAFFPGGEDAKMQQKKLYRYVVYQSTLLFAKGLLAALVYIMGLEMDEEHKLAAAQSLALEIHRDACQLILENLEDRGVRKSTLRQLHEDYPQKCVALAENMVTQVAQ